MKPDPLHPVVLPSVAVQFAQATADLRASIAILEADVARLEAEVHSLEAAMWGAGLV